MIIEFCAGSDDNSENLRRDWPYTLGICALDQLGSMLVMILHYQELDLANCQIERWASVRL